VPELYLPAFLRESLGYSTHAMVSLPVLNPSTVLNHGFDSYHLMPQHNDMRAMLPGMKFSPERPSFHLLNVGETHDPHALPGEHPDEWPRISGVHGVFKHLDERAVGGKLITRGKAQFEKRTLVTLRARQVEAVRHLHPYITITSDHGELFGEDGYFGHGTIHHNKVFEFFFVEGKLG